MADPRAVGALAEVAARDAGDRWTRAAVLSSIAVRSRPMVEALAARPGFLASSEGREWLGELAEIVGAENRPDDLRAFLDGFAGESSNPGESLAAILGLGRGLRRSGGSLASILGGPASARIAPLFARASRVAGSPEATPSARLDAIRLLALGPVDPALDALPELLDAREPASLQVAAVQALGDLHDQRVGPAIVDRWKTAGPACRREAAEVLFARPERLEALLAAIEAGRIAPGELDPARVKSLLDHRDPAIRARAVAFFSKAAPPDRAATLGRYRKALEPPGDPDRGRLAFAKACATCHRAAGQGAQVGPDLATVAGRTPEDLLIHILDPNREVAANYVNYSVATVDGRTLTGLIAEETAGAITLKRAEGATDVVPRGQIEQVASTGLSLMPEGLDQALDPRDMADLIAFLRSLGSAPAPPAGKN